MSVISEDDGPEVSDQAPDLPRFPPPRFEMPLRKPVTLGDEPVIETLVLREPTCEEWEEINEHPLVTRRRYAISRICAIPMAAVAKMGIGDVQRAENYIFAFFEVGQTIRDW